MGAAAVEPQTPETLPVETPAAESASPPPAESGGEGKPPAEGEKPPGVEGAQAESTPHVPWARFRQVQTEFTRARRGWADEQQKLTAQIEQSRKELEGIRRVEREYRAIEAALRAHPDLAEALAERLGSGRPGTQSPTAALPPEAAADLKAMRSHANEWRADREAQRSERERALAAQEEQQVRAELDTNLRKILTERNYGEALLPAARAYILHRIREEKMEDADFEDVPYLLADFFKAIEGVHQGRMQSYRNGKEQDRALPASPGVSPPVSAKPAYGAMDGDTAKILEEELAKRGWNNAGGV